ncbi:MAG: hypothetical protein OEV93_04490, partial [Candidatus Moranbacteria bacterium]|nr:hypothetical protein [Candidatus Moranbacteria bacterium]
MKTKFNETKNVRFELEKNISEILVVNDKDLAPFIEVLNFSPENITQKPLGTLLGFFEIKDDNKDSAYIVNFLSSVAKKEYFSNSKRHPIDSFESALHKINVALSEIAKHNNISWVGKLDIALCVITEDEIHFSVTGDARIFLVRDRQMTEISEGLSSSEATINPIKTFIDISSGQVEEKDKIIITSEDIFHVLSEKEIEEGAQSFPNKKFTRFIRTALINELAIAGTIIVDFFKKEIRPVVTKRPRIQRELMQTTEIPNAFSLSAFNRKTSVEKLYDYSEDSPLQKTKDDEYIDTKTGHIYLKDNDELIPKESDWDRFASVMREKYFDFKCWFKDNVTKKVSAEKTTTLFQKTVRKTFSTIKDSKSTKSKKSQKFKNRKKNTDEIDFTDHSREENDTKTKITPDFPKIKKVFFGMNSKQKIYSIVLIAVIILSP